MTDRQSSDHVEAPDLQAYEEESQASSEDANNLPLAKGAPPPPPPPRDILVGPLLYVLISFVVLVFTVVSIGIPWYRVRQYRPGGGPSTEGLFYLFKHESKVAGFRTVVTHAGDLCTPVQKRTRALQAFAIVSAALTFLAFLLSIINCIKSGAHRTIRYATIFFAGAALCSLTIEVSFNFNIYLWSFAACGPGTSYHSQLYEPYAGFGLTITAWILSMVGGIIVSNVLIVPADARTVDRCINTATFLSFAATVFTVVGCPLTHWFYKDGTTNVSTDVLLWRSYTSTFEWLHAPNGHNNTWIGEMGCKLLERYFRAAQVFSILSIGFTAAALVSCLLLCESLMGTRLPSLVFSYVSAVMTLVQFALELKMYYGSWCDGAYAYSRHYYVLSVGFALAVTGFCVMCIASAAMTFAFVLTEKYFPAKKPVKTAHQILVEAVE